MDSGKMISLCVTFAAIGFVIAYLGWGMHPLLQARAIRAISRRERVRMVSDVNTRLEGYKVRPNRVVSITTVLVLLLWVIVLYDQPLLIAWGLGVAMAVFERDRALRAPWQKVQTFVLTTSGVHLFPAREGRMVWADERVEFLSWKELDRYRFDGGYVYLFHGEEKRLQFEFNARDMEKLRELFADLNVLRAEPSDRIWLGQFDEEAFFQLEDELTELGWNLIDLFRQELDDMGLQVEFGVMRNMGGDRLQDEYARSWLQLNLLDDEGEKRGQSAFPLWQSHGNIGNLIGVRGQEAVDHLQKWIKNVIVEVQEQREEVMLS